MQTLAVLFFVQVVFGSISPVKQEIPGCPSFVPCQKLDCANPIENIIHDPATGEPVCKLCDTCPIIPACPSLVACQKLDCPNPIEHVSRGADGEPICQLCDTCPSECPVPTCQPISSCEPGTILTFDRIFTHEGRECVDTCPRCEPVSGCPEPTYCQPRRKCRRGLEWARRAFRLITGEICEGCGDCLPECLDFPCAPPRCDNPVGTDAILFGRKCPGCATCPIPAKG